ncbi:uncharacterized protein LOC134694730 [Mytilus trossulus]|uniref:uncharacterized protein LOC134694730 n=1 Tax=Mytilus trossulus TaxID=6551 RepID=UPI0030041045
MSQTDRELSLKIYPHLCNIFGTEEVVKTRRKLLCAYDSVLRILNFTVISSGSKAEGLDLNGSDYDQMFIHHLFQVYENKENVSSSAKNTPIVMDISDTNPGFTKLKLYEQRHMYHINQWRETVNGETYISSKLFREHGLRSSMIIHGPCQSFPGDIYDLAFCLRCKEWVTPAHQWVFRSRSTWPDHGLVMSVIKEGVLFVPIGCKGSLDEDLEWRISFSMAEKQLIFSFSHTQLLCYALLKIILKDIIKGKHGDLICSYFLKTILFWVFEESRPSDWHPGNIIPCFINCLKRLIYCVQYKTCPHYFIPENNFFESRFTNYQHKCLLNTLHDIYNSLWPFIFHTDTFQGFIKEQINSSFPYLTASSISCLSMTSFWFLFLRSTSITSIININDKELSTHMMSLFAINLMQSSVELNFEASNNLVYYQYQIQLKCFKAGLYFDAISTWSLLASLFYKQKRFHECKYIINYTLSKCTPDKIVLPCNSLPEQTYFQKVKEAVGMLLTCKHLIIGMLLFKRPYYLLPVELFPLIQHRFSKYAFRIPAVVYLNMLSFLCVYHIGDNRGKLNALRDLELTIRERYFILPCDKEMVIQCFQIVKSMM